MKMARQIEGIPVVASESERDLLFPTPATDQRVQIRDGEEQRYNGVAWITSPTFTAAQRAQGVHVVTDPKYGAVGDGVTDATAAIQAAHAAGRHVHYPLGRYKVSRQIDAIWDDAITITADPGTVIDASTSPDPFGLFVGGTPIPAGGVPDLYNRATRVGGQALGADVARGDRTLTVSGLGLAAGDIIRLSSSDLFTESYTVAWKGELAKVYAVSGSPVQTVTLSGQLMDSYTAATTKVFKIGSPRVAISNLTVVRDSNTIGLQVWEARDVDLNNVEVRGARQVGLGVAYCFGGQVRNCHVRDAYGGGNSYALSIATCQHLSVVGGTFMEGRLGASVGGYEPSRFISILGGSYDCVLGGLAPVGLDTHGNTEYVSIVGAHIKGGACLSARNLTFCDNTIQQDHAEVGVNLFFQTDSDYTLVTGNAVRVSSGYGHFRFYSERDGKTAKAIICRANVSVGAITNSHGGFWFSPFSTVGTGFTVESLVLSNNHVDAAGSSAGAAVLIDAGTGGGAAGDRWTVRYLSIDGGVYRGFTGLAASPLAGDQANIRGGRFLSVRSDGGYGSLIDNFTDTRIVGPHFKDEAVAKGLRITPIARLDVDGMTLENAAANGGLHLESGTYQWTMRDLNQINCTGTIINANHAANGICLAYTGYSKVPGPLPVRTLYDIAAPTGGTYRVGDRTYNSAPAVGQPKSWVCTVAGTPGTWVSEGNL